MAVCIVDRTSDVSSLDTRVTSLENVVNGNGANSLNTRFVKLDTGKINNIQLTGNVTIHGGDGVVVDSDSVSRTITLTNKFANLSSGTDLNDINYNYQGYVDAGSISLNRPSVRPGELIVIAGTGGRAITQFFHPTVYVSGDTVTEYPIYVRSCYNSNWTPWKILIGNYSEASKFTVPVRIDSSYLRFRSNIIDGKASPSSSGTGGNGVYFYDLNSNLDTSATPQQKYLIGRFIPYKQSTGYQGVYITAYAPVLNSIGDYQENEVKTNSLGLFVDNNGDPKITVTGSDSNKIKAAWRTAIDAQQTLPQSSIDKIDELSFSTTETISNIISVTSSNGSISYASFAKYGKVAQLWIEWKNKNAITVGAGGDVEDIVIGTLVEGKRPWSFLYTDCGSDSIMISSGRTENNPGRVRLTRCEGRGSSYTVPANTQFYFSAVYILA